MLTKFVAYVLMTFIINELKNLYTGTKLYIYRSIYIISQRQRKKINYEKVLVYIHLRKVLITTIFRS